MKSPQAIEFKGLNLALTVLKAALRNADLDAVEAVLARLCATSPDFFDHDPTVFDLAHLDPGSAPDLAALAALLRRYRLNPIGVCNADGALHEQARSAGLIVLSDADLQAPRQQSARQAQNAAEPALAVVSAEPAAQPLPAGAAPPSAAPAAGKLQPPPAEPSPPPPPPPSLPSGTLIIDRPLRSGQQVYARGGDVVLLAMVNAGAEVIADGNVHVYAPLRGRALAGAGGNTQARILTTCFEAELVSIAGIYRTFEPGAAGELAGRPAQIRLFSAAGSEKQQLLVEPLAIR